MGESVFPRKTQILSLKEEEMDRAHVKRLLSTKILNLFFHAYAFWSITWEKAAWVVADERRG